MRPVVGVAVAVIVIAVGVAACVWMPGRSHDGNRPPLSGDERLLAARLRAHVVTLAGAIGERNWGHYDALERARAYIGDELAGAGYRVLDRPYVHRGETFHNVEAVVGEPTDPSIVVGAHYDSVDGSPGANDNGSGVAALIEVARLLRQGGHATAFRFVAFANEEPPYFNAGDGMGSVEYVRGLVDPARTVGFMVSLETMAFFSDEPGSQRYPPGIGLFYPDRGDFVAFVANPQSLRLLRRFVGAFRARATVPSRGAALPAAIPGVAWSDHRSFWDAGVPALMVTDTAIFRDPAYHRGTDTADRLDYDRFTRVVEGVSTALATLATP